MCVMLVVVSLAVMFTGQGSGRGEQRVPQGFRR